VSRIPIRLNGTVPTRQPRRGAALYIAVAGTTMVVSVLALSAMAIVRIERRQATSVNARLLARSHARSAVEVALHRINSNSSWRSSYTNGVETAALSPGGTGTLSWSVRDTDGSLSNSDGVLRVKGFGRVGTTVQISSVEVRAGETTAVMRKHELTNFLGIPIDPDRVDLRSGEWWGQYFKATLPANANGWKITGIEFRARRLNIRDFRVVLYQAGGGNQSVGTVIESFTRSSSGISNTSFSWIPISFPGTTRLEADQGVTLMLESSSTQAPIEVSFNNDNGAGADTAFIRADEDGIDSIAVNRALQFRIHGTYTTSGDVNAVAGTWEWDSP
jgi:Tfp pilus assembly protein PilX